MTKPGTAPATDRRPLSEVARHVVAPDGIKSTEWPSVRDTCRRLGWGFDGWQHGAGKLILSKRADGTYAADTTVISIPRQAGKTYLIACIIFALCLLKPGITVIWTAHRKTTARETFDQFDGMAKRPKVAAHIRQVLHGKGDEAIHFVNGSRILFGARESGFGRGFAGVDVLVCDEGQILPESTLEDLGATQNTAPNPLFFVMGTPPRPRDPGEFFTLLRQEALDGESDSTLYIETSADRGTDPMDAEQLRKANPSFPHRTTYRALLRLRKKLKNDDAWNREARGIWDEIAKQFSPINGPLWAEGVDVGPADGTKPNGMAVDMSHAREISVGACWLEDDSAHVEEVWAGVDEPAAVDWVAKRAGRRMPVFIDGQSPAASMIPALKARGVKVYTGNGSDMSKACGLVKSGVEAGRLTHADQQSVNDAREGARKRAIGTAGGWGYDRSNPSVNIAPLVAVTLARLAASMTKRPKTDRQAGGKVVVL
ncbi:MAG: terminase [Dermatophilaceae bacterium]|nr:terminase [Dermatophilaceae bacterium]